MRTNAVDLGNCRGNVASQWGEDGIISKVFEIIGTRNRVCIDVGAFDLVTYSNTHHLWKDLAWRAVLIEGNRAAYERMLDDGGPPENVVLLNRYVTLRGDNCLDNLLGELSIPEGFDLLSIDVDGIDYHLWKSLTRFRPRVVVVEFNPTIPPPIDVIGAETGNYVGSSARALLNLGVSKGYALVACTQLNAIFVVAEAASSFLHANDLEVLFDYSNINYVMTSFDGGPFFSNPSMPFGYNPFSGEVRGKMEGEARFQRPSDRLSDYLLLWVRERARRLKRRLLGSPALGPRHR